MVRLENVLRTERDGIAECPDRRSRLREPVPRQIGRAIERSEDVRGHPLLGCDCARCLQL